MTLVGFTESSHPVFEKSDIVFLARPCGTKYGQNPLGVLPSPTIHFGELEKHFYFAETVKISDEKQQILMMLNQLNQNE